MNKLRSYWVTLAALFRAWSAVTEQLEAGWYRLGRWLVDVFKHLLFRMDVHYLANLPEGARILAANHPSTIDPFLMTTLVPEQVSILITEVLFKVPVVGASLRRTGHIRVDAGKGGTAMLSALQKLAEARTVGIFPEGVISPISGGMHKAHSGLARLALASGKPVVPVGIAIEKDKITRIRTRVDGVEEIGTWYFQGGYAVTVGEPLTFIGDAEDRQQVARVSEQLVTAIEALSAVSAARLAAKRRRLLSVIIRPWSIPIGWLSRLIPGYIPLSDY